MTPSSTSPALNLPTPPDFPFPFAKPYDIQVDLMRTVFEAVEGRKIAIVESPTGTGKSLSLLTATLTWLEQNEKRLTRVSLEELEVRLKAENKDEPAWVIQHTLKRHLADLESSSLALKDRLAAARKREREIARTNARGERGFKRTRTGEDLGQNGEGRGKGEEEFLPVDVDIGGANEGQDAGGFSKEVRELMRQLENQAQPKEDPSTEPDTPKVYYTSRTHSQLKQLSSELGKTIYGGGVSLVGGGDEQGGDGEHVVRAVPLAGRRQLCINEKVREIGRTKGDDRMNEACLDLQKSDSKTGRCPHLPSKEREDLMLDFRDQILASPKDIEDIVELGKAQSMCPYYGTRRSVKQAQLVTLPYNLLLQKSAREALGFSLKDHVVVIDEAHNLIDTLLSLHSISLPLTHLETALTQISTYYQRFKNRLKPVHALHLKQCGSVIRGLINASKDWAAEGGTMDGKAQTNKNKEQLFKVNDLMGSLTGGADQVNLVELVGYLKESQLARKISGYAEKTAKDETKAGKREASYINITAFHQVESFLMSLTEGNEDGRILLSSQIVNKVDLVQNVITLRYILLNPAEHFSSVVKEARSVILAGGTMAPMNDFMQLFPPKSEVTTLSCAHVIPKSNLLTQVVTMGPAKKEMDFKFDKRDDVAMLNDLGALISSVINLIPDGVVVFLPSYAFLAKVKALWTSSGLLAKLDLRKKVFYEPQSSGEVDEVLRLYAQAIAEPEAGSKRRGALLLAVVGAKLSEGINFSDSLGRGVIMVGLPFANTGSVELKERMRHVATLPGAAANAGQELYENLCMKAVNQSIGRAIRHQNDYAAILLVDKRYSSPRISSKLPKWIGRDVKVGDFSDAARGLAGFFKEKRMNTLTKA